MSGTQSESVNQAMSNEPLCELAIPASEPLLKAVGLGIMVSFVLAAGIVPTEMGWVYAIM